MTLDSALKTSLEELRMQMLGAQALFGFQFQGLFQDTFDSLPPSGRIADAAGLGCMVMVLGLIVAVPCQHRIVEQGDATPRILGVSLRHAKFTLAPLAAAIACDIYVATGSAFGSMTNGALSVATIVLALAAWYVLGLMMRRQTRSGAPPMPNAPTPLHTKIEQLLTEARVILPGAQALLGFQLIVMMTQAFGRLAPMAQLIHLIALMSLVCSIILLICPAAIHRIAFEGRDAQRFHDAGSWFVTLALLPLAASISCDMWVALFKLNGKEVLPTVGALLTAAVLLTLWFFLPFAIRAKMRRPRRAHANRIAAAALHRRPK